MSLRLQVVIALLALFMLLYLVNMVRTKKIDLRYCLSWMALVVLVLILDIFPFILFYITRLLGIETPSNMVFFVGYIFAIILIFSLTVSVSRLSDKVKILTQEIALLRKDMEDMRKEQGEDDKQGE